MVTPALVDLVCALYEDLYGKIGAKILRLLLTRGRCTAAEIAKATELAPTAVQRTLVSLITNRFVLFWQRNSRTHYFGNWSQIYSLLWTGQLVSALPQEQHDAMLEAIVEGLVSPTEQNKELIQSKYLQLATEWEYWPEQELIESIESQKQREVQSNPETMGKSEAAKRTQVVADAQRDLQRIRFRPETAAPGETALYKINFSKFLVESRRHELAAFAARSVGAVTAKVYEIVLRLSEKSIVEPKALRTPEPDSTVSTQEIVAELKDSGLLDEMRAAFARPGSGAEAEQEEIKEESSAKRAKTNNGTALNLKNSYAFSLSSMKPAELVNKHLDLLVESRLGNFVQRVSSRQGGEWFVPFDKIITDLQQATFDEIVSTSLGEPAARLVRLIRSKGKLDEKMLGNHALLSSLEIRHQMSALAFLGFVDIQELAKPNDRGSSAAAQKRSLFLWYHRPKWAYMRLLDLLYKQLLDTVRETQALRAKHQILLAKLSREDVKSDINQFLTEREREELNEFNSKEQEAYKKMNMIDRHVRIFREY